MVVHLDEPLVVLITVETLVNRAGGFDVSSPPHSLQFLEQFFRMADVLQQMGANDEVEGVISKWETLRVSDDQRAVYDRGTITGSFGIIGQEPVAQNVGSQIGILAAANIEYQICGREIEAPHKCKL